MNLFIELIPTYKRGSGGTSFVTKPEKAFWAEL
jgi:hypothetical protein